MWHALRDADTAATAAATRHRDILHGGNTFFTVVDAGKVSLSPRRVDERMRGRYFHTIA
jgi:preprotein translocase subunit SecA